MYVFFAKKNCWPKKKNVWEKNYLTKKIWVEISSAEFFSGLKKLSTPKKIARKKFWPTIFIWSKKNYRPKKIRPTNFNQPKKNVANKFVDNNLKKLAKRNQVTKFLANKKF